jgi:hypothetical protein
LKSVFCRAQNFLSTLLTLAARQGEQFAQRAQTFALAGVLLPGEGLQIFFDSLLAKSDFSYDEAMMTN